MPLTARANKELQQMAQQKLKEGTSDPVEKLRLKCLARGADGIAGISREFRIMDVDGSHSLTLEEFKVGCERFGVSLQKGEADAIFGAIDRDNSGSINFDEFIEALRISRRESREEACSTFDKVFHTPVKLCAEQPPMSQHRKELILKAFNKLDKTGDGKITADDLKGVYDVTRHSKFKSGEWSEERVLNEFLKTFERPDQTDNVVTKDEFFNYYAGISASIDNDAYFDLMMRHAYKL